MAQVPANMPPSRPSRQEAESTAERLNRSDPRNRIYGFNRGVAEEAFRATQQSHVAPKGVPAPTRLRNRDVIDESFAAALPIASGRGEFARTTNYRATLRRYGENNRVTEAYAVLQDRPEAEGMGFDQTAGLFYSPNDKYPNRAADPRNHENGPAALTVRPTSTTNPRRPRTVAAGYDRERQTLTVVFRDGTFYNYYSVAYQMWTAFKAAKSKGKYIFEKLNSKPRGYADMSYLSEKAQELFYRVSRTNQILYQGNQGIRPNRQPRAQQVAYRQGKNPAATSGKNPAQKTGRRKNP
jgi:hypothetical protein